MQCELEILKTKLADQEKDIAMHEARASELEDNMRGLTSLAGCGDNDETFEAVLRSEF